MTYQMTCDCVANQAGTTQGSFISRALNALKVAIENRLAAYRIKRQARIDRAAFQQMLRLDDDILDDIGVTRANVEWASQLPLHESAGLALEATKKRAKPKIRR